MINIRETAPDDLYNDRSTIVRAVIFFIEGNIYFSPSFRSLTVSIG